MKKKLTFVLWIFLTLICIQVSALEEVSPPFLYKIVSPEAWEESLLQDQVARTAIDIDFIHLSSEEQVAQTAQKFWNGKDYILLKIDTNKLLGNLVFETNPGGSTKYYHLYEGIIPLDAIVEINVVLKTPNL